MTQHPRLRTVLEAWTVVILVLFLGWFVFSANRPARSFVADDPSSRKACAVVHAGMSQEEALEIVQAKLDPSYVSLEENRYSKPGEKVLMVDRCVVSFTGAKVESTYIAPPSYEEP